MPNNDPKCQIEKMREAGRLASLVLDHVEAAIQPGVTTGELDAICREYISSDLGAYPACLDTGFPGAVCISVNHVACHGIPSSRELRQGDSLNIDVVVRKDGHHGDHSRMFHVGKPRRLAERLANATHLAMMKAIDQVRPGLSLKKLGATVEDVVRRYGYSVVEAFCGHGIGRSMHEAPQVTHTRRSASDLTLEPGMTFTIEPIVNVGKPAVKVLADGWTVVTRDRSLSAQWEHTVLVTDSGHEVLTVS